ncbi:MAG TPA: LamB/YcsF family protein [Desulfobacterales bacterium]|nr:MAG: LamB/YcsF family protein [Deltaproteobacteria bacterium]HHC24189.1 LamB/YcsF family protein [Desulfobacterales bacterium]
MKIDLNCDMGESFGPYKIGRDDEVIKYITSANIACGWHAGDSAIMDKTVRMAMLNNVSVGAHPGYPDLHGFGRKRIDYPPEDIRTLVMYQIGALQAFCTAHGTRLRHVKPHGALYLAAVEREPVARSIAEAIASVDPELIYVALAGKKGELMRSIGTELGLKVIYEAFPDRAYTPEGTLAPRREPGAVIKDPEEIARRAVMMAKEGRITATDGTEIDLTAQTLCVHGDSDAALESVKRIREVFDDEGIEVSPIKYM